MPEDKYSKVELKNKNVTTIRTEIQQVLVDKLNNAIPEHLKSISDCYKFACENDIKIDEVNVDSKVGKRKAERVMEKIFSLDKSLSLPLQDTSPWHQMTVHNKESNALRRQCAIFKPIIDCFMKYSVEINANIIKHFLQWLKLFLADHSRQILQSEENSHITELSKKLNTLKDQDKANFFPQVMAEIMNNEDASHVPTLWVLAVVEKLKEMCGKDIAREE